MRQALIMAATTLGLAGLLPIRAHACEVTLFPDTKIFDPEPRILHQRLGLDDAGKARFFGAEAEIPYAAIASVELDSDRRNAAILLGNGDRFGAEMLTKRWRVKTAFGEHEPCNQHTRKLLSGFTVTSGDVNVVDGDCTSTPDFSTPSRAIALDGAGGSIMESDRIFAAGSHRLEFSLAGHPFRSGTVLVEFGTFSKEYHLAARQPLVRERERIVVEKPARLRFTFEGSGEGGPTLDDVVVGTSR